MPDVCLITIEKAMAELWVSKIQNKEKIEVALTEPEIQLYFFNNTFL